jgi:hypothetical protein
MRLIVLACVTSLLTACSYKEKVTSLSNEELCRNLGNYTFARHQEGISITRKEIKTRDIERERCKSLAQEKYKAVKKARKQERCEALADYYEDGDYAGFKKMLTELHKRNMVDNECRQIAKFRLQQKWWPSEKGIINAIKEALEDLSDIQSEPRDVNVYVD